MSSLFTPEDKTFFRALEAEQLGASPDVPEGMPEDEKQDILRARADEALAVRRESERRQQQNQQVAQIINAPELSVEEKRAQLNRLGVSEPVSSPAQDPNTLVDFATREQPAVGGRRGPSDYGMGGAQSRIGRAGREYAGALGELQEKGEALRQERRAVEEDQSALALDQAEQEGMLLERREKKFRDIAANRAALQAERETKMADAHTRLGEARESLKYFNIPEDKRLELMERRNDTSLPEEERRKAAAELDKGSKIDPGRYMGNAKNAIFAALGSALLGYVGRPEVAANIIQARIREDIRAQETARDARAGQVREAKGALAEMQRHFKDRGQALVAAEIIATEGAKRELEMLSTKYAGPQEQLRAQGVMAQLDQQSLELQQKFNQASHNAIVKDEQARAGIGAQRAQLDLARGKAAAKAGLAGQKQIETPYGRYVVDPKGTTPTKEAFTKATKTAATMGAAHKSIERAIELRKKYGTEHLGGPVQGEMELLQGDIVASLGQARDAGVIQEGEFRRLKEQVGDISGIGFVVSRLEALDKIFRSKMDSAASAAGLMRQGTKLPTGATEGFE